MHRETDRPELQSEFFSARQMGADSTWENSHRAPLNNHPSVNGLRSSNTDLRRAHSPSRLLQARQRKFQLHFTLFTG